MHHTKEKPLLTLAPVLILLFFSFDCENNEPLMRSICLLDSTVLTGVWSRVDTANQLPDTAFLDFTCSSKWFIYHVNNGVPAVAFEGDYWVDSSHIQVHVTNNPGGALFLCDSLSVTALYSFNVSHDSLEFSIVRDSCNTQNLFEGGSWIKRP